MSLLVAVAGGISVIAFAWHGAALVWTTAMVAEFERYGLRHQRLRIGALQLAGSAGLLVGLWFRPLFPLAAGSLAVMMLVAVAYRLHVRDPLIALLPAIALCGINLFLVITTR